MLHIYAFCRLQDPTTSALWGCAQDNGHALADSYCPKRAVVGRPETVTHRQNHLHHGRLQHYAHRLRGALWDHVLWHPGRVHLWLWRRGDHLLRRYSGLHRRMRYQNPNPSHHLFQRIAFWFVQKTSFGALFVKMCQFFHIWGICKMHFSNILQTFLFAWFKKKQ